MDKLGRCSQEDEGVEKRKRGNRSRPAVGWTKVAGIKVLTVL